jgi:hypothetical protein
MVARSRILGVESTKLFNSVYHKKYFSKFVSYKKTIDNKKKDPKQSMSFIS